MDVQAAAAIASLVPPSIFPKPPVPPSAGSPVTDSTSAVSAAAANLSVVASPDAGSSADSGNSGSSSNPAIGQTPGLATLPAGPPDGSKKHAPDTTVSSAIAQLYNAQEQNISVSFQVEQNPNEIVTVFTDKQTGKVIVQFPSETLIALAKFFDKLDGSVVNKKA
jgi:flagellar protein FlaG